MYPGARRRRLRPLKRRLARLPDAARAAGGGIGGRRGVEGGAVRPAIRLVLVLALLSTRLARASPARGPTWAGTPAAGPGAGPPGRLSPGALSLICVPAEGWNGALLVFAHGYVAFNQPLGFYHLSFGGFYVPDLVQSLGFAFATTSYRQNGLAIVEG